MSACPILYNFMNCYKKSNKFERFHDKIKYNIEKKILKLNFNYLIRFFLILCYSIVIIEYYYL